VKPDWAQWLTPVILATWEAEIRRVIVRGQPGLKVLKIPSSNKSWVRWRVPVTPVTWGSTNRMITVQAGLGIKQDPISKVTNTKMSARVFKMVVDHPTSARP
jgi:hypothetical protein